MPAKMKIIMKPGGLTSDNQPAEFLPGTQAVVNVWRYRPWSRGAHGTRPV